MISVRHSRSILSSSALFNEIARMAPAIVPGSEVTNLTSVVRIDLPQSYDVADLEALLIEIANLPSVETITLV